ncbi:MAG TPA: BatD family protein [Candidatus Sumerlaeia bacterium]|nr:BatD family protein [Candidatus Sumerlaeia bacterium]
MTVKEMMKSHLKIMALVAGLLLWTLGLWAQNVDIAASAEPSTVTPGAEFIYSVRVQVGISNLPKPQLPALDQFEILSGPNQSQSFQFINGRMSGEVQYSVGLRCMKPGDYKIAPAEIKVNGKTIKSNEVIVKVTQTSAANIPSPLKDEKIPAPSASNPDLRKQLDGKLFLRTEVSKANPFVGEPVTVSYTLYAQKGLPLVQWGLGEPQPQFREFMKEDIFQAERLSFREVAIGSETFQTALVKKIILTPTKTGKTIIDPMSVVIGLQTQTQQRRRSFFNDPFFDDPFGDPFGRRAEQVNVPSSFVELDVLPLPEPRPADFTGTVGDYTFSAKLDRASATMDDLLTLSLIISGKGSVESALQPKLPPMDGFEVYETKAKTDKKIIADAPSGSRSFDVVLRPQKSGELEIPSVSYSIFNPEKKQYVSLKSEPIKINIAEGTSKAPLVIAGHVSQQTTAGNGGAVVEINADINYIKQAKELRAGGGRPLILRGWFLLTQMLPLVFAASTFMFSRRRDALESDRGLARRLRARGAAAKRLKQAAAALNKGDSDAFYAELGFALRSFFGDMFNREPHGLTIDELVNILEERNSSQDECDAVRALLEQADSARYSPSNQSRDEMQRDYEKAFHVIQNFRKKT